MQPSRLIIHCSDTPNGRAITAREIDRWHAARTDMAQRGEAALLKNFPQYPYVGYHGIIQIDGQLVRTRAEDEKGSHCRGLNSNSLGFCLVGDNKYTMEQWEMLAWVVADCARRWGDLTISGHRDHNPEKSCPGFDVADWLEGGMKPVAGHVLEMAVQSAE